MSQQNDLSIFPFNCGLENGFKPTPGIGRGRMVPFKGSSSKSSQSTVNKDNSAVVEDEGLSANESVASREGDALSNVRGSNVISDGSRQIQRSNVEINETDAGLVGGNVEAGGGTVNIETSDAEIAGEAFGAAKNIASESDKTLRGALADAFGFSQSTVDEAINAVTENSDDAFDFADETIFQALSSNKDVSDDAFEFSETALAEIGETNATFANTLDEALDFATISQRAANETSRAANTALSNKSQDAPSAVSKELQRNILIAVSIISVAMIISKLPKK